MQTLVNGFLIAVISLAVFAIMQRWVAGTHWVISNLDYQCSHCGGYIYLPPLQVILSFHYMGRKWVRCPHCGRMTWAIPIQK